MRDRKTTVEECLAFDINFLIRKGVFRAPLGTRCNTVWSDSHGRETFRVDFWLEGDPTTPSLWLKYATNTAPALLQRIDVAEVPCHFGGARCLFRCPCTRDGYPCGRLVRKLYLIGDAWVCRTCGELTYLACQQHDRRIDFLLRSSAALNAALQSDDMKRRLLGISAFVQGAKRSLKYLESRRR